MPIQARLDAPGTLHHLIGRGIEGSPIFGTDFDRADFLGRVETLCQDGNWIVYAWAVSRCHDISGKQGGQFGGVLAPLRQYC